MNKELMRDRPELRLRIRGSGLRLCDIARELGIATSYMSQLLRGHAVLKPEVEVLINAIIERHLNNARHLNRPVM